MNPSGPPRMAVRLLSFLLDRRSREYILGDVEEEYFRHGSRNARLWYWRQVVQSIPSALARWWTELQVSETPSIRTVFGVAIFATGIGITTSAATALWHLQAFDHANEGRIVAFSDGGDWSLAEFEYVREKVKGLAGIAAWAPVGTQILSVAGFAVPVEVAAVTQGLFDMLGRESPAGWPSRLDSVQGRPELAISEDLWNRLLGADPATVGSLVSLDGQSLEVVAIMPDQVSFPSSDVSIWRIESVDRSGTDYRFMHMYHLTGRLLPGVTSGEMVAANRYLGRALHSAFSYTSNFGKEEKISVTGFRPLEAKGAYRPLLVVLGSAVSLLLLTLTNLAYVVGNRPRPSYGTVGLLIVLGGLIGIVSLTGASAALAGLLPARQLVNGASLLLAFFASGMVAYFVAQRPGASGAGAKRRSKLVAELLAVGQLAVGVVLVLAAVAVAKSFWQVMRIDPGFSTERLTIAQASFPQQTSTGDRARILHEFFERLEQHTAVEYAGSVNRLPFTPGWSYRLEIDSEVVADERHVLWRSVTPSYFKAVGIELLTGRDFDHSDGVDAGPVAIVSRSLAEDYWEDVAVVGRRIRVDRPEREWLTIIGVVEDIRTEGLKQAASPVVYQPFAQARDKSAVFLVLRSAPGWGPIPTSLIDKVSSEAAPDLSIAGVGSLMPAMSRELSRDRKLLILMSLLAALAVLLGTLALSNLSSTLKLQGRDRSNLSRPILRVSVWGLAIGLTLGFALSRFLESGLYSVNITDPDVLAATVLISIVVAMISFVVPSAA